MSKPAWQRRNEANLNSASKADLDAFMLRKYGLPYDAVDEVCKIGAKLARGDVIGIDDSRMLKSIYAEVPSHLIQRSIDEVNALPVTLRPQAFAHHLVGDASPDNTMVKEVLSLVNEYASKEISVGIEEKRAANAPRDAEGRVIPPTPKPRHDPLSARSLIEQQVLGHERAAARAINENPEIAREALASRADLALDKLEANTAGVLPLDTRSTIEAAYDLHSTLDVAADQGLIDSPEEK